MIIYTDGIGFHSDDGSDSPVDPQTGQPLGAPPNSQWNPGVGWESVAAPTQNTDAPGTPSGTGDPTTPPPDDGGGMPAITLGELLGLPSLPNVPDAPQPDLPTWNTPAPFTPPDANAMTIDPSYKFRRDQSLDGLQRWAAAKGTLNDSGTANALTDYAGNAASQEYQNIWNRGLQGYQTNYQTQHVDPYRYAYQAALDMNAPRIQTWQAKNDNNRLGYSTTAAWNQNQNNNTYQDYWNRQRNALDYASL